MRGTIGVPFRRREHLAHRAVVRDGIVRRNDGPEADAPFLVGPEPRTKRCIVAVRHLHVVIAIAVFTEICWALSLKWAAMQGTWQASAVPVTLSFVNMALLAFAMREISAGTAYAIWTGLGAVGVIIGGIILFE